MNRNLQLWVGLSIMAFCVLAAAIGPSFVPYNAYEVDLRVALEGASLSHLLGTDALGRDQLVRMMVGARYSLAMALGSVFVVTLLGVLVGVSSAYAQGGLVDNVLMGATEVVMGIPIVIMAVIVVSLVPSKIVGVVVAIVAVYTPTMIRLARSKALEIRTECYIESAFAIGASVPRIILRHMLPNALGPIIVEATLRVGESIILIAALSYIGLGVNPPIPEWGVLLSQGRDYMFSFPYLILYPGIGLGLIIFGFNLFGEGLSRWFLLKRR